MSLLILHKSRTTWVLLASFLRVCVCCFILFYQYLGIVTVSVSFLFKGPGVARSSPFTLTLGYVAGYTGSLRLFFLFKRTHNYYVDNQGLVPWQLRRVGRSKVGLASLVRVLGDGKISQAL